ncbi:MAG: cytochrome C oxidase subunit IV family protein [Burkholderiaceae bacterium]|nr:cytochrome C oxidase subunit IV family protein [Burkholderiaceae bacterium]
MTPGRRTDGLWLALLAATALAWWLGETGAAASAWTPAAVWLLAGAKGAVIALDFMALRQAPPLWRRLVLGWLATVIVLLAGVGAWAGVAVQPG